MRITVIAVGKIKEKFYRDAIDEYKKRLSAYTDYSIIEVADEPDSPIAVSNEGKRIIEKIPDKAFAIVLCIDGKKLDSVGLSEKINDLMVSGISHIVFIIGGSSGLSDEVIKRADFKLSFSDMTFPHQLMRVILSEQIYRSFKIMRNEPYHK